MCCKETHCLKQYPPKLVTLLGMVIDCKEEQSKQLLPKVVTLLDSFISVYAQILLFACVPEIYVGKL